MRIFFNFGKSFLKNGKGQTCENGFGDEISLCTNFAWLITWFFVFSDSHVHYLWYNVCFISMPNTY